MSKALDFSRISLLDWLGIYVPLTFFIWVVPPSIYRNIVFCNNYGLRLTVYESNYSQITFKPLCGVEIDQSVFQCEIEIYCLILYHQCLPIFVRK